MSIKYINALSSDLKEILRMAQKDCLMLSEISSIGVKHQLADETSIVQIYSFLPGLEEVQIIVKSCLNQKKKYIWFTLA